mgnify:CR=1 FL=1
MLDGDDVLPGFRFSWERSLRAPDGGRRPPPLHSPGMDTIPRMPSARWLPTTSCSRPVTVMRAKRERTRRLPRLPTGGVEPLSGAPPGVSAPGAVTRASPATTVSFPVDSAGVRAAASRLSWYPMSESADRGGRTRTTRSEVPSTGLRYRDKRGEQKFFMRQSIADGRSGETAVDERELAWVVGSSEPLADVPHRRRREAFPGAGLLADAADPVLGTCAPATSATTTVTSARDIGRTCVYCHNVG